MKLPAFFVIVLGGAIAIPSTFYDINLFNLHQTTRQVKRASAKSETVQFICDLDYNRLTREKIPTTYAYTPRGKIALIRWNYGWFDPFDSEARCNQASPQFDKAYRNGNLNYLTNGRLNRERVICAVEENGDRCTDGTMIFSLGSVDHNLEEGELYNLDQLNLILQGETAASVVQSTPKHPDGTEKVYIQLNISNFLAKAPVKGR